MGTGSVHGSIDYRRSLLRVIHGDVVKKCLYDHEIALSKKFVDWMWAYSRNYESKGGPTLVWNCGFEIMPGRYTFAGDGVVEKRMLPIFANARRLVET
jgi:hypothetical protein